MPVVLKTTLLLVCSNVFMTFARYAHLRDLRNVRQPMKLDFLWASLCLCGAVYFVFRS